MQKEQLVKYLNNQPLIAAIRQKIEINGIKTKLYEAREVLLKVKAGENALSEIESKLNEYRKISKAYNNMIEDTWEIKWQDISIIERYIDSSDDELIKLPCELSL